jgi:hypothetical protein
MFFAMLTLAAGLAAAAPPPDPRPAAEFDKMLAAILSGSMMGPGEGWFGPSEKRYDWAWLAARHGVPATGTLPRAKFTGPPALFAALDRDGDGVLRAEDFDWGDNAPFVRQLGQARQWVGRADRDNDGKLSKAEWDALFARAAGGKDHLSPEDVRSLLFPPAPPRPSGPPTGMPSQKTLLLGLLSGEIGSWHRGPMVGETAPDFTLPTQDGKTTVTLSDYRAKRPVVLVFGSFT